MRPDRRRHLPHRRRPPRRWTQAAHRVSAMATRQAAGGPGPPPQDRRRRGSVPRSCRARRSCVLDRGPGDTVTGLIELVVDYIHRHGPRMNRRPDQRPFSSDPRRGNFCSAARLRRTRSRLSAEGVRTAISRSRSPTAAAASSTLARGYRSSSATVSSAAACCRPSCASSYAPPMRSSSATALTGSGSASSMALDSRDLASVPSLTWTHALTKGYGTTTAVDGLTPQVAPGRVTGFLGPNGAGKTTMDGRRRGRTDVGPGAGQRPCGRRSQVAVA